MAPNVDAASFNAALSSPPIASLDAAVKDFLRESFQEGCDSAADLSELVAPYLLDAGLAADEAEAGKICNDAFRRSGQNDVDCGKTEEPAPASKRMAGAPRSMAALVPEAADEVVAADVAHRSAAQAGYGGTGNSKCKQAAAKKAARSKGNNAVAAATAPGAELQLAAVMPEAEAVKAIAKALQANRSAAGSEGPGEDFIGASFVAYAQEKEPRSLQGWTSTLLEVLEDANTHLDEDEGDHKAAVERVVHQLIKSGVLEARQRALEVGEQVLAVLVEDDDWHPAAVLERLEDDQVRVIFIEYGKPQVVKAEDVRMMENVVDEDAGEMEEGNCEMCSRYMMLTFHHLIPKDTHRKYIGKRLPAGVEGEPTRWFLNKHGTMICRPCHNTVHHFATNDVLGAEYNTLEKLMAVPAIQKWVEFAKKQSPGKRAIGQNIV
eukprot:TRINITY_DN4849_c0_g1_i1.p1 TRINITY_DN4849_c0_g1~~TRINITY_DN4849_c0_g1_i1.p1  ORF type:complete len:435 (-),score=154.54 TRINITY_DN4849_c0_g1_i1:120-1424(-)